MAIWKNKFVFYNLLALIFVKAIFSYSGFQFASLIDGTSIFSKTEVITQTNLLRRALGLNELKESSILDLAATQKLQDMVQNKYFAHTSPSGISPWHWIELNQYKYSYAGENLAIGFLTAEDTVNAWANSPSHRANLLNSNYKEIGIAVAPAEIDNSQGFLVVQLFGTPGPTVSPKPTMNLGQIAQTKPSSTVLPTTTPLTTQVSISIPPTVEKLIEKPIVSQINDVGPKLESWGSVLNKTFILYLFIIFLVSIVVLAFNGLKKALVVRTVTSFAVLVLAIILPVIQISHKALIL